MKKMKFWMVFAILILSLAGLVSCKSDKDDEAEEKEYGKVSAYEICMSVKDSQKDFALGNTEDASMKDSEEVFTVLYDKADFTDLVSDYYYIGSAGASSDEVAAAVVKKSANREKVKKIFEERIAYRKQMFTGYAPEEVKKLEKAKVFEYGEYIVMVVCDDMDGAKKALNKVTKKGYEEIYGQPTPTELPATPTPTPTPTEAPVDTPTPTEDAPHPVIPTEEPSPYNVDKAYGTGYENGFNPLIVTAYQQKNRALLTDLQDQELFDRCSEILDEVLGGKSMSAVQAETEIYRYIVTHIDYDYTHYSIEGNFVNSDNPYGALFRHVAICTGYSSTFNLLCSMIGLEVINVNGTAFREREAHGWNMIKLGPCWYYVDPCWGWTGSGSYNFYYMNITEQMMTDTEHYWDKEGLPEADTLTYEERKKAGYEGIAASDTFESPETKKVWVEK